MTVLDAQAIVAVLVGEAAAPVVEALLRDPVDRPQTSTLSLAEVMDVLVRHRGRSIEEVTEKLDWLAVGGLEEVPVDRRTALRAGALRARHYDRWTCPVSLADCVALAVALNTRASLATSDPALARAARRDGVAVVALPDSRGMKP